jgi:hypothetical protein
MNRRKFLATSSLSTGMFLCKRAAYAFGSPSADGAPIQLHVDEERTLGVIPDDFTGLGYEISSVSTPGLLSAKNHVYVQLVRTLGAKGVIRIGGNTSDFSSFAPQGQAVSSPKGTVVTEANFEDLGTFLDATGWTLIWGLNLGRGSEQEAVEEAQAITKIAKDHLLAFEIGNETDLFPRVGHRPKTYGYDDYLKEYRRYKAAIRASLPHAPFAGPDTAGMVNDWVTRFAADEGSDLKVLTHHYYREGQNPTSSLAKLLNPDPRLDSMIAMMKQASTAAHVPYRICETNSFSGGGRPGVSDTFGAALWTLDYMLTLAWGDAGGVNMETGVNHLGFVSSYSPLGDDTHGTYTAMADYYGMLAFAQAGQGNRLALDYDTAGVNLKAYAVARDRNHLIVTIINRETSREADVEVLCKHQRSHATAMRLTAPSMESKDGVTLAGSAVTASGAWQPGRTEPVQVSHGLCHLRVAAGSAVLVSLLR